MAAFSTTRRVRSPNDSELSSKTQSDRSRSRSLLFVKILLKYLSDSRDHNSCKEAKAIILVCVQRNRMGDPEFSPLQDALEAFLRELIDDACWNRAEWLTKSFLDKKERLRAEVKLGATMTRLPNDLNCDSKIV